MTEKRSNSEIPGDAEVAGAFRKRRIGLPMRSDFFPNPPRIAELLTPAASGCTAGRPLTKSEDQDTIIINRSARSTYPTRKSVRRSGATPTFRRGRTFSRRLHQILGTSKLQVASSFERPVHVLKHSADSILEGYEMLLRPLLCESRRVTDLQLRERILESTLELGVPKQIAQPLVREDFGATEQIFKGLRSHPTAPIGAKSRTCQ